MPASQNYTSYEIIASGNIEQNYSFENIDSFPKLQENPVKKTVIDDLFTLIKYINNNAFFLAQIEQIYVNQDNEFELIPRVGNQTILFGTIDNYEIKFNNLEAFYKKAMNKVGWNKYKTISVQFDNQIVCSY